MDDSEGGQPPAEHSTEPRMQLAAAAAADEATAPEMNADETDDRPAADEVRPAEEATDEPARAKGKEKEIAVEPSTQPQPSSSLFSFPDPPPPEVDEPPPTSEADKAAAEERRRARDERRKKEQEELEVDYNAFPRTAASYVLSTKPNNAEVSWWSDDGGKSSRAKGKQVDRQGEPGPKWERRPDRAPQKLPVRFIDAIGRNFMWPWKKARDWKVRGMSLFFFFLSFRPGRQRPMSRPPPPLRRSPDVPPCTLATGSHC
jgi:hypothetical protein